MFLAYNLIFFVYGIFYFPYALIRGKNMSGFWFRFGQIPEAVRQSLDGKENIWVHAVSVGEVLAVTDLIKKLKERFPSKHIVLSTVTATGYEVARANFKNGETVMFAPFDFSWVAAKFVRLVNPQVYIAAETEIWPNLYTCLSQKKTPIVQVNGRISDRSFKRYSKVKFLTRPILGFVTRFCMQSEEDALRIAELGADKSRILIPGNLKFDNLPAETILKATDLGFNFDDEILLAGSTHPGEEQIMLDIYRKLKSQHPHLRLVLCPRHVERAEEVLRIAEENHLTSVRLSQIENSQEYLDRVVVVDTIGKLRELYSIATLVFVGKTLRVGGGQNMIEPAFFGKATLVGPLTYNFKDVMKIFLKDAAMVQVQNEDELFKKIGELLNDPHKRNTIGENARRLVQKYQGATVKTVQTISGVLS